MSEKPSHPHARGSFQEALGKITGDAEIEVQGRAERLTEQTGPEPVKAPGRRARKAFPSA